MTDFQQRAQQAAAKAQSLNPAEAFAQSLTCDRPTMDSAVKSFLSLTAARSLASSDPNNILLNNASIKNTSDKDKLKNALLNNIAQEKCFFIKSKNPQQAALLCARQILKTINSFQIPDDDEKSQDPPDDALDIKVIRILWNGLIKSGKKPSKLLGRKSLIHVYPFILNDLKSASINGVDPLEVTSFMSEFGMLLNAANKRRDVSLNKKELDKLNETDDDSCLLWDVDGGRVELDRRKHRRKKHAGSVASLEEGNEDEGDCTRFEVISEGDET